MKKMTAIFSAAMFALACAPLTASAWSPGDDCSWARELHQNDPYTVVCDNFTYTTDEDGIYIVSDLPEAELIAGQDDKMIYMIGGVLRGKTGRVGDAVLVPVNCAPDNCLAERVHMYEGCNYFPDDLKLGDFVVFGEDTEWLCDFPGKLVTREKITRIGNGVDMFGDEFVKVLRHELVCAPNAGWSCVVNESAMTFDIVPGDVTEDEEIDLIDVVAVNKHVMLGTKFNSYAYLAGDVDQNGMVDETDALNILKCVLDIIPDFTELQG